MNFKKALRAGAVLILALLPLYYVRLDVASLPTNLVEMAVGLLFLGVAITGLLRPLPQRGPIILIVIGLLISTVVALDRTIALGIVKGWFIVPILYYWILISLFEAQSDKEVLYRAALFTTVMTSFYALGQWLGWIGLLSHQGLIAEQYLSQHRAIGFFESPNFLAMYLVPPIVLLFAYFQAKRPPWHTYFWLAMPLGAVILSGSRAGLAALIIGLVAYLLALPGRFSVVAKVAASIFSLVLLALLFIATLGRTSNDQHLVIWQGAVSLVRIHWLLGIGPGQFQAYFGALTNLGTAWQTALPYALHPHNVFLNFWLSTGIVGLLGFIWLLIGVTQQAWESRNKVAVGAWAAIVAIIAQGLFDSTYFKNDLAIWFYFFVFIIVCSTRTENAKDL